MSHPVLIYGLAIVGMLLMFWLGWNIRRQQYLKLKAMYDWLHQSADASSACAAKWEQSSDQWQVRAMKAETELQRRIADPAKRSEVRQRNSAGQFCKA